MIGKLEEREFIRLHKGAGRTNTRMHFHGAAEEILEEVLSNRVY